MCVCMCVSCGVSFCVCMCVSLCVLWLPSVTCVGHVLSLPGWGRRSWETAEHKGDSDRQAGSRQAACQGASAPNLRLLRLGGGGQQGLWAWTIHAATMPLCSTMCSHPPMQAWPPSFTPTPTIPHPQATLKSFLMWFSLKSNLHPSSVASIHKIPSHLGKRFPTPGHLLAPVTQPGHQTHKRNMPFGALTKVVPPHTHTPAHRSSSCPHATPRLRGKLSPFSYWSQALCPKFWANLPSTSNLTTHTHLLPTICRN